MTQFCVLIIEDDATIGLVLEEMLQDIGHTVCAIAMTEDQAVADAARFGPGLIIADQRLQKGSGLSAVQRILQREPIPFLFISGAPIPGAHPSTVLPKPFVQKDLADAIHRALALSKSEIIHHLGALTVNRPAKHRPTCPRDGAN